MIHYRNNIDQALSVSDQLYNAVKESQWDSVESLITQRDLAVDIAFPDNLPEEFYDEARQAFSAIQNQQEEITVLTGLKLKQHKHSTINEKRGKKSIQTYLS